MPNTTRSLMHDLVLPTLLFAALGGMTWAVRGCSGYGAMKGCLFAGVTWGAAWWYLARTPGPEQERRYASGWIILAMAVGIGVAGGRGWMQWPAFFEGRLLLDAPNNKFVEISPSYGFVWQFISGIPWAGLGACLLAWCAPARPMRQVDWGLRLTMGFGAAIVAGMVFRSFPDVFLPLYSSLKAEYADHAANPNLRRLIGDNRLAITFLGLYLGFLSFEVLRRDWKNVVLILTVGLINGAGWSMLQNWHWAAGIWPDVKMNWWRCWESSGGISIGVAYGVAYYLVNRPVSMSERESLGELLRNSRPNLERFGAYFGLIFGLGLSIRNGLTGWANIYLGDEQYWSGVFSLIVLPFLLAATAWLVYRVRTHPRPLGYGGDLFPHAGKMIAAVIIVQNILAQMVTGPASAWTESLFKVYYLFILLLSGVILFHYHTLKKQSTRSFTTRESQA